MAKKILVVDDDETLVEFLSTILKAEKYEVSKAYNGREACVIARQSKPDLILLDLLMPIMHGFDVCEELRADPSMAGVKILICSAKGYDVDKKAAERLGADQFLVKPIKNEDLIKAIKGLIGAP